MNNRISAIFTSFVASVLTFTVANNSTTTETVSASEESMVVINTTMDVRPEMSWASINLETVSPGDSVTQIWSDGFDNGWSKIITSQGTVGFVPSQNLEKASVASDFTVANNTVPNADVYAEVYAESTVESANVIASFTPSISYWGNDWYNICLAANSLNGYELQPSETFSWNATIGEATTGEPYKISSAFASENDVVQVYGGGVCVVSGCMNTVAKIAGLNTQSVAHLQDVSGFEYGYEAAVSYGECDLVIQNTCDTKVRFSFSLENGRITCYLIAE